MRSEFLIQRGDKTFALYAGLLDAAHSQGLQKIETTLIQVPTAENGNVAICSAVVTMLVWNEESKQHLIKTFSGLGDASPANVARAMITCTIRMAETRAKARALRDAVNVSAACLEETGEEELFGENKNSPNGKALDIPTMLREVYTSEEGKAPVLAPRFVELAGEAYRALLAQGYSEAHARHTLKKHVPGNNVTKAEQLAQKVKTMPLPAA